MDNHDSHIRPGSSDPREKIFNIFASENEVYTIFKLLQYFRLNIILLQGKINLGHTNSIAKNRSIQYFRSGHYFMDIQYNHDSHRHSHIVIISQFF